MEMPKETFFNRVYEECEKRWSKTHKSSWINGNMSERVKLFQKVKGELLSK